MGWGGGGGDVFQCAVCAPLHVGVSIYFIVYTTIGHSHSNCSSNCSHKSPPLFHFHVCFYRTIYKTIYKTIYRYFCIFSSYF